MSGKTVEKDRGYKRIIKELEKLRDKPHVKVGYPKENEDTKAKHEDGVTTVLHLALIHEFGAGNVPERSFVRAAYDIHKKEYQAMTKKLMGEIIDGNHTVESALGLIGLKMQNDIKALMVEGIEPKRKDSTVKRIEAKRNMPASDRPLIDTAQLLNSIHYEIVVKEAE